MDGEELSKCVPKPCITAGDECYNCEWSTELTVPQAYDEYVKAWFACKLLAKELELGDPDAEVAPGTLFENLPEEWVCPECAEKKDMFIEA